MGYLSDYILYSSGTECPEEYLWWSALNLQGAVLSGKVWIEHGDYFRFTPNTFVCLVGHPGSGKNTAISVPKKTMYENFPDLMVSASIQSREDIADLMASDACLHTWKNGDGKIFEYRPYYILNNELASFLSVDKIKMVEFLTDVFDGADFSTGFKTQRLENPNRQQRFHNPCVSLLAGATPDWFMGSLKSDIFNGGLGRRLIIVHCRATKIVSDPRKPKGAREAMDRVVRHLKTAREFKGAIVRTPDAMKWWNEWYNSHKRRVPEDPVLAQFHTTKHVQLLKLATNIHLSEKFELQMPVEPLQAALALLDKLEPEVVHLTSGVGPNVLAGISVRLLENIRQMGGAAVEKRIHTTFYRFVNDRDWREIVDHLCHSEQLISYPLEKDGIRRETLMLPEFFEDCKKKGLIK